jgi:sensor domain CHASE-containing protein
MKKFTKLVKDFFTKNVLLKLLAVGLAIVCVIFINI